MTEQGPRAPEGWYPDPTGRYEHRYWDGSCWQLRVMDAGVPGIDERAAPSREQRTAATSPSTILLRQAGSKPAVTVQRESSSSPDDSVDTTPTGSGATGGSERSAPDRKRRRERIVGVSILTVFAAAFLGVLIRYGMYGAKAPSSPSASSNATSETATVDGVYDMCNRFVEDRLQFPGSSSFQGIDDAQLSVEGDTGTDISYVDAANGFGAKSRVPFNCTVRYTGNGHWTLEDLQIDTSS